MTRFEQKSVYLVNEPEIATLFLNKEIFKFLKPFFPCERSLADVAKENSWSLPLLHRKVQTFLHLGILVLTDEQVRRGRPVKLYQTAAKEFFVASTALSLETLFEKTEKQYHEAFVDSLLRLCAHMHRDFGMRFFLHHDGGVRSIISKEPGKDWSLEEDTPIAYNHWSTMHLSEEFARALQADLEHLRVRYLAKQQNTEPAYLTHFGLLPIELQTE